MLMVSPEVRFLSRSLGYMGVDIILSPGAWASPADHEPDRISSKEPGVDCWRKVYIPVAKDFSIYIVGVSNVGWITAGPWEGMKCIGCSLAVDSGGDIVAEGKYGVDADELVIAEVEIINHETKGTNFFRMLKMSGYEGP